MLKRDALSSMETIKGCVEKALSRGLFSLKLFEKYGVLTSSGVQRRYFEAAQQKRAAKIRREFLLIDISKYANAVIIDENRVFINENATKVEVEVKVEVKEEVKEKEIYQTESADERRKIDGRLDSDFFDRIGEHVVTVLMARTFVQRGFNIDAILETIDELKLIAGLKVDTNIGRYVLGCLNKRRENAAEFNADGTRKSKRGRDRPDLFYRVQIDPESTFPVDKGGKINPEKWVGYAEVVIDDRENEELFARVEDIKRFGLKMRERPPRRAIREKV